MSITRDPFNVGQSATARCRSDTLATLMEWLTNGLVVESATSTQQLDLVVTQVNDSIHNQVYICRVTREGEMLAIQSFTVKVDGKINYIPSVSYNCNALIAIVPPDAISASVSRSGTARAGMIYNLTCTVSKRVGGLINSPTAMWTTGGMAVSDGNDITVSTITTDTTTTSTLTFDPLRTSHGGSYSCSGTLTSPALETPLTSSTLEEHRVQSEQSHFLLTPPRLGGRLFVNVHLGCV